MADGFLGYGARPATRGAMLAAGVLAAGVISAACASPDGTPARPSASTPDSPAPADCGPRQRARAPDCEHLRATARRAGDVAVIVTLAVPFTPEGDLTPEQTRAQRRAIAAAQDALLADLAPHRPTVTARYTATPQLALVVSPAALDALLDSRRVSDIQQNTPQPPG